MGFTYTSYFGLARINNSGPEAQNWAVTDSNPEVISKVMYALSRHTHGGATPIKYPGYNYVDPSTPTLFSLVESSTPTGGVLSPGTSVGARLSYVDSSGLETEASPERILDLSFPPNPPTGPGASAPVSTPVAGALGGGVYIYGITKTLGSGETELSSTSLVEVPYSSSAVGSYTVDLTFDALSDYSDGTTGIKLYRAAGLGSQFQLVATFTDAVTPAASTPIVFTDSGALQDAAVSPPIVSTFNKNRVARIVLSNLVHPPQAIFLKVYVTRTPGQYTANNLLEQVELAATPTLAGLDYLGSESLASDFPKNFSQLPLLPGKINLGTEAYGAPILTTNMNFAGYQGLQFVLPSGLSNSTPIDGALYYDSTSRTVKFRINGAWTSLATPTGGYVHSADEPGGHSATRIYHSANAGGVPANKIFDILATPIAYDPATPTQYRKVVQPVYRSAIETTNLQYSGTTQSNLLSLSQDIIPAFAGQWLEIIFTGGFIIDPQGASSATMSLQLEIDESLVQGEETYRSFTAPATPTHASAHIYFATPISNRIPLIRVKWLTTTGTITSLSKRRTLYAKLLL
jgi:hypothetical protein